MTPNQILVTRPEAEAHTTAGRLAALGWHPILAPLLTITPRRIAIPSATTAILVASGNALLALPPAPLPLLAVGDATAARARAAGFPDVRSASGTAAELATLAAATLPPGALVLLAAGARQGHVLAQALRAAGLRVHRRTAYIPRPVPSLPIAALDALEARTLHAALFLSADTARTFARLLPRALHPALATVEALAIGPPAAEALALLPWRRVRVSLAPTLEQVLALL